MQDITNELVIFKTSDKGEDIKRSLIRITGAINETINDSVIAYRYIEQSVYGDDD